jgi:hypothetical protein
MPRRKESLKIVVVRSTEGEEVKVEVTVTAPAKDFLLPDLLSKQGAIDPYDIGLSEAVRAATESYLEGATAAVAAIAEQKQGQKPSASSPKSKQNNTNKETSPKREKRLDEVTTKPEPDSENHALTGRINGPIAGA